MIFTDYENNFMLPGDGDGSQVIFVHVKFPSSLHLGRGTVGQRIFNKFGTFGPFFILLDHWGSAALPQLKT